MIEGSTWERPTFDPEAQTDILHICRWPMVILFVVNIVHAQSMCVFVFFLH